MKEFLVLDSTVLFFIIPLIFAACFLGCQLGVQAAKDDKANVNEKGD